MTDNTQTFEVWLDTDMCMIVYREKEERPCDNDVVVYNLHHSLDASVCQTVFTAVCARLEQVRGYHHDARFDIACFLTPVADLLKNKDKESTSITRDPQRFAVCMDTYVKGINSIIPNGFTEDKSAINVAVIYENQLRHSVAITTDSPIEPTAISTAVPSDKTIVLVNNGSQSNHVYAYGDPMHIDGDWNAMGLVLVGCIASHYLTITEARGLLYYIRNVLNMDAHDSDETTRLNLISTILGGVQAILRLKYQTSVENGSVKPINDRDTYPDRWTAPNRSQGEREVTPAKVAAEQCEHTKPTPPPMTAAAYLEQSGISDDDIVVPVILSPTSADGVYSIGLAKASALSDSRESLGSGFIVCTISAEHLTEPNAKLLYDYLGETTLTPPTNLARTKHVMMTVFSLKNALGELHKDAVDGGWITDGRVGVFDIRRFFTSAYLGYLRIELTPSQRGVTDEVYVATALKTTREARIMGDWQAAWPSSAISKEI